MVQLIELDREQPVHAFALPCFSDVTNTENGERESGNECIAVTCLRIQMAEKTTFTNTVFIARSRCSVED